MDGCNKSVQAAIKKYGGGTKGMCTAHQKLVYITPRRPSAAAEAEAPAPAAVVSRRERGKRAAKRDERATKLGVQAAAAVTLTQLHAAPSAEGERSAAAARAIELAAAAAAAAHEAVLTTQLSEAKSREAVLTAQLAEAGARERAAAVPPVSALVAAMMAPVAAVAVVAPARPSGGNQQTMVQRAGVTLRRETEAREAAEREADRLRAEADQLRAELAVFLQEAAAQQAPVESAGESESKTEEM